MTKRDLRSIAARARRGARLLDKKLPGWHRKVKITTLDISECRDCALGQAHPSGFSAGVWDVLEGEEKPSRVIAPRLVYFGFDQVRGDDYGPLTEAWKDEIRDRRRPKVSA